MSHAKLSASGASRWMTCTPSAHLEADYEDSSSPFAAEGTLAHEFAEMRLRRYSKQISQQKMSAITKRIHNDELYSPEMDKYIQDYVDYVVRVHSDGGELHIEQRLDMSAYIPEGFGTGDAIVINDGTMTVIDLKYGKGIRVDADENPQLMLYGLGALQAFGLLYDIHTVRLVVVQPRLDHISEWEISVEDLSEWGDNIVRPLAEVAFEGKGEFVTGKHCRFCRHATHCRALRDENLRIAQQVDFAEPTALSEDEILEIYRIKPVLNAWINQIDAYVQAKALDGYHWDGFKLVAGRSTRVITDVDKAAELLLEAGNTQIFNNKLLGITALEKSVGKKELNKLIGHLVVKPEGKPTLVPEEDKRPVLTLSSPEEDFKKDE